MSRTSISPLRFKTRAALFKQLGALEEAGLPIDKALGHMRVSPVARLRLASMRRCISKGMAVAEAGLKSGLFTPLEASLLHAASSAGSLARAYRRLSDNYARRAARAATMRARMTPVLAMVLIAIFVQPLPRLIAGTLSPLGYLAKCLLELAAVGAVAALLTELPYHVPAESLAARTIPLDRFLPRVPLFGPMHAQRNVRDCFDTLALLLAAGMPILEALPLAVDVMRSESLKQQFSQIKPRIEAGATLAQAIGELSFVGSEQAHAMILAGEASGALPEVLFGYVESETVTINRFDDLVAEWSPRIVYTLVALWIGYGILTSGAFMPSLPPDLR